MYIIRIHVIFVAIFLLSGCLYPQDKQIQNQVPYEDQLKSVQSAVERYQKNTGVLPIKTRDSDTPIFRKYPIDFARMMPTYMQTPPGNSFENGGIYQYVLVNPEDKPEVKLVDLRMVRNIQELERRLIEYQRKHQYPPVVDVVGDDLLELDYSELNYEVEPTVESPFHPNHRLPLLLQTNGRIVIDYSLAIQHFLQEYGRGDLSEGDDFRELLINHSPFVPVYSLPQTVKNDRAQFISNRK